MAADGEHGSAPALQQQPLKGKDYILDTNILVTDPSAILSFEEHNVIVPMKVLEELDKLKTTKTSVAQAAREAQHALERALAYKNGDLCEGIPLEQMSGGQATGKLFFQTKRYDGDQDFLLNDQLESADNQILLFAFMQQRERPDREIVVVSKDLNMRIRGEMANIPVEDYRSDRVIQDSDVLPTGITELTQAWWDSNDQTETGGPERAPDTMEISGPEAAKLPLNEFVFSEEEKFYAHVVAKADNRVTLERIPNYFSPKNAVYGVNAKNVHQLSALAACLNRDKKCVIIAGSAGSGKTYIAVAVAFHLVVNLKLYDRIMFVCAAVDADDGIGFLPGTEEEKMGPRVGGLYDNVRRLHKGMELDKHDHKTRDADKASMDFLMKNYVDIKSLTHMRGRSIQDTIIIVDETQNMTAAQVRLMASRVGEGSKIIFLGNLAQIDTKYLTAGTCGLAHLVMGFRGLPGCAHIVMPAGVRSLIANYANEYL